MPLDITPLTNIGKGLGKALIYGLLGTGILGGISYLVLLYLRRKKYEYLIRIWKREYDKNDNLIQTGSDVGGIFIDKKTNNRLFKIKNHKVSMSADNIPFFYGVNNQKVVNILQKGLKEFVFLDKPISTYNSPEVFAHAIQDKDIAFAVNEIERAKLFEKKTMLQQLIPFIGMAFVFVTVVVAFYFIFVKAGFNSNLLMQVIETNHQISENLVRISQLQSGTVIVQGGG